MWCGSVYPLKMRFKQIWRTNRCLLFYVTFLYSLFGNFLFCFVFWKNVLKTRLKSRLIICIGLLLKGHHRFKLWQSYCSNTAFIVIKVSISCLMKVLFISLKSSMKFGWHTSMLHFFVYPIEQLYRFPPPLTVLWPLTTCLTSTVIPLLFNYLCPQ